MDPKSRIPVQVSGAILSCKSVYLIAYWLFPSGNFGGTSNSTLSNLIHNFSPIFLLMLVNGTPWLLKSETQGPTLTPLSLTTPDSNETVSPKYFPDPFACLSPQGQHPLVAHYPFLSGLLKSFLNYFSTLSHAILQTNVHCAPGCFLQSKKFDHGTPMLNILQ